MTSRPRIDDDHSLFASKAPHFFKVILEEAIRDGKLEIPRNFVRKHAKLLTSPVQLEVPSGAKWQVELAKCDEMVWLQKGWQEFAVHYSLKFGYFVVFRYEGNSHFRVLIFDKSASEIEYPYTSSDDDDGDMDVELCIDVSESKESKEKSYLPCPRPHKKMRIDSPNHPGTDLKLEILSSHSGADDPKSRKMKLENLKKIEKKRCSTRQIDATKGVGGLTGPRTVKTEVFNCLRRLTATEKAHAVQRAIAFKSIENPTFVVIMQPSCFHRRDRLYIPMDFARKYFRRRNRNLTLCDSTRKTWPAKYSLSSNVNKQNPRIRGGWRAFAEDHNLDVGDICVFELIRQPDILLKVVIHPVDQNASKASRPVADGSIPTKGVGGITGPRTVKTEVLNCVRRLTATEKPQAIQRASAFKSTENPAFVVVMQPWNFFRRDRIKIPVNFARKYFTRQDRNLTLCDSTGKTWPAMYSLSSKINKQTPRIHGGWRAFAEDHNLDVGDVCVLELIKHPDILLKVVVYPVDHNASKACWPPADGSISGRAKIRSLSNGTEPKHGQNRCQYSFRESKDSNIEENTNLCRKSELPSKMEPLTLTEKERAFIRASAFKSANPSFTVRMQPSYVNGATLYIPRQFSHRYLKNNSEVSLRVSDGRTWIVDYKRKASSLQPKAEFLSNSLRAFVLDNNLKVGDICVFELIAENGILLEVAIFSSAEIASYSRSN